MLGKLFGLGDDDERDVIKAPVGGGGGSGIVRTLLSEALREYDREVANLTAEVASLKAQLQANHPSPRPGGHLQHRPLFQGWCANDDITCKHEEISEFMPDVFAKLSIEKLHEIDGEFDSESVEPCGPSDGLAALTIRRETGEFPLSNSSAATAPKGGSRASTAEGVALPEHVPSTGTPVRKRHGHGVQGLINKSDTAAGSPFQKFATRLEICISVVIVINTFFLCLQLQVDGTRQGAILKSENIASTPTLDVVMDAVSITFNTIFLLELILRLAMFRRAFFVSPSGIQYFNMIDALLVLVPTLELLVFAVLLDSSNEVNTSLLRMFRTVRLLRFLRIYRTVKLFKKLNMLVATVASSVIAVFWSLVLLAIIMLGSAMFMVQALLPSLSDERISKSTRDWIFANYGTTSRAYFTVFEFTFSGCWPSYARMLIDEVNVAWTLFFAAYVVSVSFTIFRIITAIFLRESMALLQNDTEMVAQEQLDAKKAYASKLTDFFIAADTNQDGVITVDEFKTILAHPEVTAWLAAMGIEIHDIEEMFQAMDDGDGMISYEEFSRSIVYLKGTARASDLFHIKESVKKLGHKLQELTHIVAENQERSKENEQKLGMMEERLSAQDGAPHLLFEASF